VPVQQPYPYASDSAISLCPLTYFRDNPEMEAKVFHLHLHWQKGILPAPGSLDDQAAGFSAVVAAAETGISAGRSRKQEIQMAKADRQNRGTGTQKRGPRRKRR
jgi:hypothetical protein